MPVALFILILLYIRLVIWRTRGVNGVMLEADAIRAAERLLTFVRVALMLGSIVLLASLYRASTPGADSGILSFLVIAGTVACYVLTIASAIRMIGLRREIGKMRDER